MRDRLKSKVYVDALAQRIAVLAAPTWCIFDNIAPSAATANALVLLELLGKTHRIANGLP